MRAEDVVEIKKKNEGNEEPWGQSVGNTTDIYEWWSSHR